jgi:surface antigen
MNRLTLLAIPLTALLLAGCTTSGTTTQVASAPVVTPQPIITQPAIPTSAETVQTARLTTSIANGFVDAAALSRMTAKDSNEANSAQFYALQFGRPGAPRQWAGDQGTTGSVSVGPYVRVNNLDCRDFTHTVKIGGQDYVKAGTACREQNGNWVVEGTA